MRARSHPAMRPPCSETTVPTGRSTSTAMPVLRSILSISAPSARRSPESVAPLSAARRTSGGVSRVTRPLITPASAQDGASGSSAYGSSQTDSHSRLASPALGARTACAAGKSILFSLFVLSLTILPAALFRAPFRAAGRPGLWPSRGAHAAADRGAALGCRAGRGGMVAGRLDAGSRQAPARKDDAQAIS